MLVARIGLVTLLASSIGGPTPDAAPPLPDVEEIDGAPVRTLLPPDAIPAIDKPRFVDADEAEAFMADDEPVLGVVDGGLAKAYSLWVLDRHEVVNDRFGERHLAVTW